MVSLYTFAKINNTPNARLRDSHLFRVEQCGQRIIIVVIVVVVVVVHQCGLLDLSFSLSRAVICYFAAASSPTRG